MPGLRQQSGCAEFRDGQPRHQEPAEIPAVANGLLASRLLASYTTDCAVPIDGKTTAVVVRTRAQPVRNRRVAESNRSPRYLPIAARDAAIWRAEPVSL